MPPSPPTLARDRARFRAKVDKRGPDECWDWKGATHNGYGSFRLRGYSRNAHRAAWLLFRGPHDGLARIPKGIDVCHSCDRPICVNPHHLWLGTRAANVADARSKGRLRGGRPPRLSCPRGHARHYDRWGNCIDCRREHDRTPARRERKRKTGVRAARPFLSLTAEAAYAVAADYSRAIDVEATEEGAQPVLVEGEATDA